MSGSNEFFIHAFEFVAAIDAEHENEAIIYSYWVCYNIYYFKQLSIFDSWLTQSGTDRPCLCSLTA